MKKLFGLSVLVLLFVVILGSSCRPPEVEGVVVNMQQGLYDKAFDLAKEAVQKYPENAEAWYLLGQLYGRKDNFVEMNKAFEKSLAISQQYAADIERIRFNYFAENYNSALNNYYKKAREVDDPQKRQELFQKAAEKFLNAYQAAPERSEPLTPMSVSFLEVGDTTQAEGYLEKAIELNPQNDTLMVQVGDFYYKIDKNERAKALYLKALEVNPDNTQAHLALGQVYSDEEVWDKAIEHFDIAAKAEPDNAAIPMNIAIMYYNNENYEKAIPYIQKTIELDPSNKDMYELLSICYLQKEMYDEALPFLEDSVQKFPDSELLWNNLGVVYAQKGMKEKAEDAFERQKALSGEN